MNYPNWRNKKFQVARDLTDEEYFDLKESIRKNGVLVPVEIDENGDVLDGHHRVRICEELAIECPTKVISGLKNDEEKLSYAEDVNYKRRQLSREEKNERLRKKIIANPEKSDRQIAKETGVSPTTVGVARNQLESDGKVSKLDTSKGSDGKTYKRPKPKKKGEEDMTDVFSGIKHSKMPIEKQKEILDYCEGHELESTVNIAKKFGVDYSTIERIRNYIGQHNPATRALNNRIKKMEIDKSVFCESDIKANDYSESDAIDELNVMLNEFTSKVERMLEIRKPIVSKNKKIIKLIESFTKDIYRLAETIK